MAILRKQLPSVVLATGLLCLPLLGQAQNRYGFDMNKDVKTGIEIGRPIPPLQLLDQYGKSQNFNTIKGPRGAVLIFFRSADW